MNRTERLDICLEVVKSFLGKPYSWGGDDPMAGFDCSGLVIEGLKACGLLPRRGDWTADGLMRDRGWDDPEVAAPGCLVFWGDGVKAQHVEMIVAADEFGNTWTIGASGGGPMVGTLDDAIRENAFIKIRPTRPGYMSMRDPFAEDR